MGEHWTPASWRWCWECRQWHAIPRRCRRIQFWIQFAPLLYHFAILVVVLSPLTVTSYEMNLAYTRNSEYFLVNPLIHLYIYIRLLAYTNLKWNCHITHAYIYSGMRHTRTHVHKHKHTRSLTSQHWHWYGWLSKNAYESIIYQPFNSKWFRIPPIYIVYMCCAVLVFLANTFSNFFLAQRDCK